MKIETKFSIGDQVYYVYERDATKTAPCELCEGSRNVVLREKYYQCPECFGRGYRMGPVMRQWVVLGPTPVGQVRFLQEGTYRTREEYMLEETGVGSGTVHRAEQVFATESEAQDWINRNCGSEPTRGRFYGMDETDEEVL